MERRWLKERFTFPELVGVVLASAGGVITAISVVNSGVQRRLLSNLTQLASRGRLHAGGGGGGRLLEVVGR